MPRPRAGSQRVAVLLDLESLEKGALDTFDGLLSSTGLLEQIVAGRKNPRSIVYLPRDSRSRRETFEGAGFDSLVVEENRQRRLVQLVVDAIAVAPRVEIVTIGTNDPSLEPLADYLKAQGVRVEFAGFSGGKGISDVPFVELGRESIILP